MILYIENIETPRSGEYEEFVYDIQTPWRSQQWTWLKFINDDYYEWCCEFRGDYRGHGISNKDEIIYVLTSNYLYLLKLDDGSMIKYIDRPDFRNLTVAPDGTCIVANDYHLSIVDSNGIELETIETPIPLDTVSFIEWQENNLIMHAMEFLNWDNSVSLKLDGNTLEVEVISQTNPGVRYRK